MDHHLCCRRADSDWAIVELRLLAVLIKEHDPVRESQICETLNLKLDKHKYTDYLKAEK